MEKKNIGYSFFPGIKATWKLLKFLAGKYANLVLARAAILVLLICYQTVFQPFILTRIYGALGTGKVSPLYTACAIGGGVVLLSFVLSYFNNVYLDLSSFKIKLLCAQNACQRLFMLPFDKINNSFKEDGLVNRIDTATLNAVSIIISLGAILSNTISIIILFSMFSVYSFILIIIAILLAAWGFLSSSIEIKLRKKYELKHQQLEDNAGGLVYDSIHEIAFTTMYGCRERLYKSYGDIRQEIWSTQWKQERVSMLVSAFTSLFSSTLRGLLSGVLFPLHKADELASSSVAASFSIYDQLSASVCNYARPFVDINTQLVNIHRLNEVLEFQQSETSDCKLFGNDYLIKTEDLCYSIDKKIILDHVTIDVKKGEKIALIGRNGCGKSTLLRVIAGLYHSNSGALIINTELLNACRNISYIPSSTLLYDNTIDKNISMNGDGDINKALLLAEFEMDGDQANISATELSGGQAQRVNIARGLVHKTSLLIADEPVSGLSIEQGEAVIKNIINESETAIIVTHHPAHLRFFSRIILLEDGKVIASGTLDDLSSNPAYARWSGEIYENVSDGAQ